MNDKLDWNQIGKDLACPFAPSEIDWKPGSVTRDKTRALALAYLNARAVMDRLDAVVGPGNWQDSYRIVADGNHVECTLTIDGVSKSDVGEPSGSDFADKVKGAYSDSLKRAAVKFGIGRYLYRLEGQWVDYDAQRKQLTRTPTLPAWALPDSVADIQSNKAPAKSNNGQTNGKPSNRIADARAWLEEQCEFVTIPGGEEEQRTILRKVWKAAVMSGEYRIQKHAENAMTHNSDTGNGGYNFPTGFEIKADQRIKCVGALRLYDWLMERKEEKTKEADTPV